MKHLSKDIFFFSILIILGVIAVMGIVLPDTSPVSFVGSMQISAFKNGLSLYQTNRHYYYTFSPFNDYIVSPTGIRSSFIDKNDAENNSYLSDFHSSFLNELVQNTLGYFYLASPEITFTRENTISYQAIPRANQVIIRRTLSSNGNTTPLILGSTISYYSSDFIYDSKGQLFTYQTPENRIDFQKIYGITLSPSSFDLLSMVPGKKLTIVNPHLAGTIVIQAGNQQTMYINVNAKLIEIEETVAPKDNKYTTDIEIDTFSDPKKAQLSL